MSRMETRSRPCSPNSSSATSRMRVFVSCGEAFIPPFQTVVLIQNKVNMNRSGKFFSAAACGRFPFGPNSPLLFDGHERDHAQFKAAASRRTPYGTLVIGENGELR